MRDKVYPFLVLLLVMNFCFKQVGWAQNIYSSRISLAFKEITLKEAFTEIHQKSGLRFVYNKQQIDDNLKVSLTVENQTLAEVIKLLLANTHTSFQQVKGNIILREQNQITKQVLPGIIQGIISDYETKEALIGATVQIEGTSIGASTDANGSFKINAVPEGNYTLIVSYVGYQTGRVENVQVQGGKATSVDYKLLPSSTELKGVEIIGDIAVREAPIINSTNTSLISEIQGSRLILTGISNEQISRSLDRDAGEVVRRVAGVTLINSQFVLIRGLDPRYNITFLNDLVAPSSESDRRAFSYDMLSSNIIDRMVIYKTPAPELQGDFAGGVVKIYTKNTSVARQLQVQLSGQYRSGSSFGDFYTYKGGRTDLLGYDDGTRALPDRLPSYESFQNNIESATTSIANAQAARLLPNNWNLQKKFVNFDKRAVISYYDSWRIGKGRSRLNNLTSLYYTLTREQNTISRQYGPATQEPATPSPGAIYRPFPDASSIDSLSTESVRIGVMQNFRFVVNDDHSFEFKNFFNQLGRDQTTVREGRSNESGTYASQIAKRIQYAYRSRGLYTGQLAGSHSFGKEKRNSLQWRGGYGVSNEQIPDQRRFELTRTQYLPGYEGNIPVEQAGYYYFGLTSYFNNPYYSRFYSTTREQTYTFAADYLKTYSSGFEWKVGTFNEYRNRSFSTRYLTYFLPYQGALIDDSLRTIRGYQPQYNIESFFAPENFRNDASGFAIYDFSKGDSPSNAYQASNQQHAAYAAVNVPLFNKQLTFYGGARFEWNRQLIEAPINATGGGQDTASIDNLTVYVLPSANISWRFSQSMLLRAAYGFTLNRPEFREVAPFRFYDFNQNANIQGDTTLKNAEIHNLDLRWELYPSANELITVGIFYKRFKNAIEYVSIAQRGFASDLLQFNNTKQADVYGAEVEIRKNLGFIPVRFFENLSVIVNGALLHSQVEFADSIFQNFNDFRTPTRALQGTSPYIINAGLYYDNSNSGTQIAALYNVAGQRIAVGANAFSADIYELPRHIIDLSVTQRITKFLVVKAGVQDLLNQSFRFFRDVNRNRRYDPQNIGPTPNFDEYVGDYLEAQYKPGSYYSFGLHFTF